MSAFSFNAETGVTDIKLNYTKKGSVFIGNIYEYDIKSAYFSIITQAINNGINIISLEDYQELVTVQNNRIDRLVFVGNLIKGYPNLSDFLHDSLKYLLLEFIRLNEIKDEQIISIKKDAIFVNKKCSIVSISNIKFNVKNVFRALFTNKIKSNLFKGSLEIFVSSPTEYIVKGISTEVVDKNTEFFSVMSNIIYNILQESNAESVIRLLDKQVEDKFKYVKTYNKRGNIILNNGFSITPKNFNSCVDKSLIYNKQYFEIFMRPFIKAVLNMII